jgi:hypothetical protein
LEHSMNPFMFPVSASHNITCPPRVVVTSSSLLVGWNSQATTSPECSRVSKIPYLPKMSQIFTVPSQEELASRAPVASDSRSVPQPCVIALLKQILEMGAVWLLRVSSS